jgi:steroid delta-isomerase-like uncharacterized protein
MSSEQQTGSSWLQEYLDAWTSHDAARVASFMTDDVVFTDMALGERHEGPAAVREFVDDMTRSFSTDVRFTMGHVVVATEDAYAAEWTMAGTHDRADEGRGVQATEKHFEIAGVSIGRLRNGKISENHDYWDMATFLTQVGLMPQP